MIKNVLISIVTLGLFGCATPLKPDQTLLTVYSNPPGATLTTGSLSGPAPAKYLYTNAKITNPITATWVSGATATARVNIVQGKELTYTINRPTNVAGLDADVKWAIHLNDEASAQSKATSDAWADALHSYNESNEQARQKANTKSFVNCTSTKMGNSVDTTCY